MNRSFNFSVTPADIAAIRLAIQKWGKPSEVVEAYSLDLLQKHFGCWARFVEKDWRGWDISEYDHDIGCRYWIQVAIEHSTPDTRLALENAVQVLDDVFRARMRPHYLRQAAGVEPLSSHPYFWETNTIFPEQETA